MALRKYFETISKKQSLNLQAWLSICHTPLFIPVFLFLFLISYKYFFCAITVSYLIHAPSILLSLRISVSYVLEKVQFLLLKTNFETIIRSHYNHFFIKPIVLVKFKIVVFGFSGKTSSIIARCTFSTYPCNLPYVDGIELVSCYHARLRPPHILSEKSDPESHTDMIRNLILRVNRIKRARFA